jgi:hypothetical protein
VDSVSPHPEELKKKKKNKLSQAAALLA